MIHEEKFYMAICDHCDDHWKSHSEEVTALADVASIKDAISCDGWHETSDGKTYCPECHEFGDDDNLILADPIIKDKE